MENNESPDINNWPLIKWGEISEACTEDMAINFWKCWFCGEIFDINCPAWQRFDCDNCKQSDKCKRIAAKQGMMTIFKCDKCGKECRQPITSAESRKVFQY